MITTGANGVLAVATLLTLAAIGIVTAEAWTKSAPGAGSREFQQLVGGIGLGASTDLWTCSSAFDMRIRSTCGRRFDPIPMGDWFCPAHMCECVARVRSERDLTAASVFHAPAH